MTDYARFSTIAAAQLSVLKTLDASGAVPDGEIQDEGTPVFDINGELLFWRAVLQTDKGSGGYVDVAAHDALGSPLLATGVGARWAPSEHIEFAASQLGDSGYDEARFVAFSFPKLAVQFLADGREVAMIELYSLARVPKARNRNENEPPAQFERWSYIDEMPGDQRERNAERFRMVLDDERDIRERLGHVGRRVHVLDMDRLIKLLSRTDSRDLHYGTRGGDHQVCFELRGQETNVWCVGASVQMVLDFYRYGYSQTRLATELGLGTPTNPNGLPFSRSSDVVTVLENMSNKSLSAAMNTSPSFSEFRTEIRANRPLISFIPGHSRAVAGFTNVRSVISVLNFRGLLVFDPWPPNAGVITRWENYDSTTYQRTFTAHVILA